MDDVKRLKLGLSVIFALLLLLFLVLAFSAPAAPKAGVHSNTTAIPPMTAAERQILSTSKGFQALISYTDRGFEPASATIKKGKTVRFTNNSSRNLWVAATGTSSGKVYPGTGKECGQSAFDSCTVLGHGDFWEFTFAVAGNWSYQNNRDTRMTGLIHVK